MTLKETIANCKLKIANFRMKEKKLPPLLAFILQFSICNFQFAISSSAAPPDLTTIKPRPGFQIELIAAEPLIVSPVAFDWGADGKLWVVEMRDYPLGMNNKGEPGGRVVYLEDTDGDGRYDKSTIFLDKLLFPTGVMTWGKGVLVTCAPDILYAEATSGSGKADKIEKLFTGFGEANPQHRVNGLRWGLDNWVYCANGDFASVRRLGRIAKPEEVGHGFSSSQAEDLRRLAFAGAAVKSVRTGKIYDIRNRDLRIKPDEGLLDPQSGQAQFGRDRDDWGNWFGCDHSQPCWHYVLDDYYLRRNPHVASPSSRVEMPRSVTYPLGAGRATGTRRVSTGNAWTSACSVMVYRDNLFGPEFANNWFTCEPVHNLIHREILEPNGVTFTSHRAPDEQTSEFLASTDARFTPVSIRTGPDGALWVADMRREVLEHPHWLPAGWEKKVDVRAGHDQGRLYRVYPIGKQPRKWPPLDRLDVKELVTVLESPNGWLRDKAQQLLVQRKEILVSDALGKLVEHGKSPQSRLHALWTLDGLDALKFSHITRAIEDPHPGVRRQVFRLLEKSKTTFVWRESYHPDLDFGVLLQFSYAPGMTRDGSRGRPVAQLLRESQDPYIQSAVLSSLSERNLESVVEAVLQSGLEVPPPVLLGLLQSSVGFSQPAATTLLLNHLFARHAQTNRSARFALIADWLDSLDQRNTPLATFSERAPKDLRNALMKSEDVFKFARNTAKNSQSALPDRSAALRLLGRGLSHQEEDQDLLFTMLGPQQPDELQVAAMSSLSQAGDPVRLLDEWRSFTPKLRSRLLEGLLSRPAGLQALLKALKDGSLSPQEIPLTARQRLLNHPQDEIREQAQKVFTDRIDADRQKVVVAYETVLKLKGDPANGLRVFQKSCATCHRLSDVGNIVGPNLAVTRDKPPEWFLPALLDPNRAVEAQFLSYVAMTKQGKTYAGILVEESGNSLALLGPGGERQVLLRNNLEELSSTGKSLMPEGLEKELSPQAIADLIAWLKSPPPN